MTPADEIHTAAAKLRKLLAKPGLTAGPWLSLDHGDRLLRNQPGDEDRAPVYVVNEPMSNGANADYIATMHPGVGTALADWLASVADLHEESHARDCQWCADEDWPCADIRHALTIARAINQETT